jgi:GNAT superfamily N-acetyltransferase
MVPADLAEVERIGAVVHADLTEPETVIAERLRLFPAGCLMTRGGYVIAHPSRIGEPPPLGALLGALPDDANALHLHDVALLPALRGQGLGGIAVRRVLELAVRQRLTHVSLVAVHGTPPYWARSGFAEAPSLVSLASYGADARYMVRAV